MLAGACGNTATTLAKVSTAPRPGSTSSSTALSSSGSLPGQGGGGTASTSPSFSHGVSGLLGGLHWIIAANVIGLLDKNGSNALARRAFDNSNTNILLNGNVLPRPLANWGSTFTIDLRSVLGVNASQLSSSKNAGFGSVLYDPEHWSFTPISEQENVSLATESLVRLAQPSNLSVIVAPGLDLMALSAPGENRASAFLASGLIQSISKVAFGIVIQSQSMETSVAVYSRFVKQAAELARSVNPTISIYAGLSTGPNGQVVSSSQLVRDVAATHSFVLGYWLNVPGQGPSCPKCAVANPEVAVGLLDALA